MGYAFQTSFYDKIKEDPDLPKTGPLRELLSNLLALEQLGSHAFHLSRHPRKQHYEATCLDALKQGACLTAAERLVQKHTKMSCLRMAIDANASQLVDELIKTMGVHGIHVVQWGKLMVRMNANFDTNPSANMVDFQNSLIKEALDMGEQLLSNVVDLNDLSRNKWELDVTKVVIDSMDVCGQEPFAVLMKHGVDVRHARWCLSNQNIWETSKEAWVMVEEEEIRQNKQHIENELGATDHKMAKGRLM